MSGIDLIDRHHEEIHRIAERHGVTRMRVFGSIARGDARPDSDVDFLVKIRKETSPWFPAGLILELEQLLGRRVDVVTEKALNPRFREDVLREAKTLR